MRPHQVLAVTLTLSQLAGAVFPQPHVYLCQNTFINFHDLFLPTSLSERLLGTLDYTGTKSFLYFIMIPLF